MKFGHNTYKKKMGGGGDWKNLYTKWSDRLMKNTFFFLFQILCGSSPTHNQFWSRVEPQAVEFRLLLRPKLHCAQKQKQNKQKNAFRTDQIPPAHPWLSVGGSRTPTRTSRDQTEPPSQWKKRKVSSHRSRIKNKFYKLLLLFVFLCEGHEGIPTRI